MAPHKCLMIWSLLLVISGCSTVPEIQERIVYVTKEIPVKERPEAVDLHDVEWFVVTADNVDDFLLEYQDKTGDMVFFAISVPHYENLSLNLAELRRYIEAQQGIIVYYETRVQEGINKTNKTDSSDQEQ
jgi:hypothetical protein